MGGFDVLKTIRSKKKTPILMLTAKGDDIDKILGLEMGADDYMPKPYNPPENCWQGLKRSSEEPARRKTQPNLRT